MADGSFVVRNLLKYPLTTEEAITVLHEQIEAYGDPAPGDMGPMALRKVADFLEMNAEAFAEFAKEKPHAAPEL